MSVHPLVSLAGIKAGTQLPGYEPKAHGVGIVHLGMGAFHRAHQAVYTDAALAASGGDWRIVGASMRSATAADCLNPQQGLYTLIERGAQRTTARIIGSISHVVVAAESTDELLQLMNDGAIGIVSLTVTEKAYALNRESGGINTDDSLVKRDLADPQNPRSVVGLLVESLRRRLASGVAPYTVLCCDNLPDNGRLLRDAVCDFAARVDPALAKKIAGSVYFPHTMVDRITPASTDTTRADALAMTGRSDRAAVETEPFSQWVIEDKFSAGRPDWEAGGAVFVDDVAPYERMKLRMLNGSHSMMAYAGFLAGHTYIREVMGNVSLAKLVRRHMQAAAATLDPLSGVDFTDYAEALIQRFTNPAIAHETWQIAMDGSEKLPQRLLEPAVAAIDGKQDIRPFAFAVAAWMRYCMGRGDPVSGNTSDEGENYALRDPREDAIASIAMKAGNDAAQLSQQLHEQLDVFPEALLNHRPWRDAVQDALGVMIEYGMQEAVEREAELQYNVDD